MKKIEKFEKMMELDKQYEADEIEASVAREFWMSMTDLERKMYDHYERTVKFENDVFCMIRPDFWPNRVATYASNLEEFGIDEFAYVDSCTADLKILAEFDKLGWKITGFKTINTGKASFGMSGYEQEDAVILKKMN